jgi:hypothetical protein
MFILYMDKSEVEELHSSPAHFVLFGVMIPAGSWKDIELTAEIAVTHGPLRPSQTWTGEKPPRPLPSRFTEHRVKRQVREESGDFLDRAQ